MLKYASVIPAIVTCELKFEIQVDHPIDSDVEVEFCDQTVTVVGPKYMVTLKAVTCDNELVILPYLNVFYVEP